MRRARARRRRRGERAHLRRRIPGSSRGRHVDEFLGRTWVDDQHPLVVGHRKGHVRQSSQRFGPRRRAAPRPMAATSPMMVRLRASVEKNAQAPVSSEVLLPTSVLRSSVGDHPLLAAMRVGAEQVHPIFLELMSKHRAPRASQTVQCVRANSAALTHLAVLCCRGYSCCKCLAVLV